MNALNSGCGSMGLLLNSDRNDRNTALIRSREEGLFNLGEPTLPVLRRCSDECLEQRVRFHGFALELRSERSQYRFNSLARRGALQSRRADAPGAPTMLR